MKILCFTLWCLLPVAMAAFHYGPGQEKLLLDDTSTLLTKAQKNIKSGNWASAVPELEEALAVLPKDRVGDAQLIRLELAKARMESGALPVARQELEVLAAELKEKSAGPQIQENTLAALASSRFHMTYLMKLEGLPDDVWEEEIDSARQEQKFLMQESATAGQAKSAADYADDLEASIRLSRMDPADLYGKPIPKKCSGCKSGKCKKPGKGPKKKGEDARGASAGPPNDGEGS